MHTITKRAANYWRAAITVTKNIEKGWSIRTSLSCVQREQSIREMQYKKLG